MNAICSPRYYWRSSASLGVKKVAAQGRRLRLLVTVLWSVAAAFPCRVSGAPVASGGEALIVRSSAEIAGAIDGSLEIGDGGKVAIEAGGTVAGDVRLGSRAPAAKADSVEENASALAARVSNRAGQAAVRGNIDTQEAYDLPQITKPVIPVAGRATEVREINPAASLFLGAGDLALELGSEIEAVTLPAGSYRDCVIRKGTLRLGLPGVTEPLRYQFNRLDIEKSGRLRVVGAVVVTLAEGGQWDAGLGDRENPLWLEVRVAGGDLTLGSGCEFYGCLSAPQSKVTVDTGARLTGALVSNELVVHPRSRVTALEADWGNTPERGNAPTFTHRALRVQRAIPALKAMLQAKYSPAVGYVQDTPYVMLVDRTKMAEALGPEAAGSAVFEAFATLFAEGGFTAGGIVLVRDDADASPPTGSTRNIFLRAVDFEAMLRSLGDKGTLAENIQAVRSNQEALAQFASRCLPASETLKPQ